jgi:MFS family permease
MQTAHPRRWTALAVIALAQFMVIMDTSIIGVALPEIQTDLGFSPGDLSWVFNAYVVAFGGLLLLGGRLSDLFGARRVFLAGWGSWPPARSQPGSLTPPASRSPRAPFRVLARRSSPRRR